VSENTAYLSEQLIAYRGNKRKLLNLLEQGLQCVRQRLGDRKLRIFDGFAGSGVCSRFFKQHASLLIANDLQPYAETLARCYLANRSSVDVGRVKALIAQLESNKYEGGESGFIERLYAPQDMKSIKPGERVYFTRRNARILDRVCQSINEFEPQDRFLLQGPLLASASLHSNTAGHFKSFLKNKNTGIGQLGGSTHARLNYLISDISLSLPVLSDFECEVQIYRQDTNMLVKELDQVDVAYYDPPYDDQPYGAMYWMLNLLVNYEEPERITRVSGKPRNWQRSDYTRKYGAGALFRDLVMNTPATFVLLSFSNEGKVSFEEIDEILAEFGKFEFLEQDHSRFNSVNRSNSQRKRGGEHNHVVERLYVLEKR